jgi:putative ABC transport system permease protein
MKYFPLIWYGIWRKKGRAMLILFQIVIAFLLFGLLQGMKSGIDAAVNRVGADVFITQRADGYDPLPLAHFEKIKSLPGVKDVSYEVRGLATYQNPKQGFFVYATDVANEVRVIQGLTIDPAVVAAMQTTRTGAVMSDELAKKYGWKKGDHITLQLGFAGLTGRQDFEFDVVGTFDPGKETLSKEFMMINYAYADEARVARKGTAQEFLFRVTDLNKAQQIAQAVDALFRNSTDETRTTSWRENAQTQMQSIGDLGFIVRAVVGAVMFALLISVGAMMMQSLRERIPELAVLKTLGFKDSSIFVLVASEILLMTLGAATLGLLLALRIVPMAKNFVGIELAIPSSVFIAGGGIALVLALVIAMPPAWHGMKLRIVEALSA